MIDRQYYTERLLAAQQAVALAEAECKRCRSAEIMRRINAQYPDADAVPVLMDVVCRRAGVKWKHYAEACHAEEMWRDAMDRLRGAEDDLEAFDRR